MEIIGLFAVVGAAVWVAWRGTRIKRLTRDEYFALVQKILGADAELTGFEGTESDGTFALHMNGNRIEADFLSCYDKAGGFSPFHLESATRQFLEISKGVLRKPSVSQWAQARDQLRVRLRGAAQGIQLGDDCVTRRFAGFVRMFLCFEHDGAPQFIRAHQLRAWGVSEDEAFGAAVANMQAAEGNPVGDIAWFVANAACLAIPGFISRFEVRGTPIIAVPDHETLFIFSDNDASVIERMARMAAAKYAEATWPISPGLFKADRHGRIVPYVDHSIDELARALSLLQVMHEQREYEAQLSAVESLAGNAVALAFSTPVALNPRRMVNWAAWKTGVDTWIPAYGTIVVGLSDEENIRVEWSEFLNTMADALEPIGAATRLPVFRPTRSPTAEEQKLLRNVACGEFALTNGSVRP